MPTPAKTSDDAILQAARVALEQSGSDGFSLNDVAAAVGVRTPSLYKRITDRKALLTALEQRGFSELALVLQECVAADRPLHRMAHAYRRFARRSPRLYERMFAADAVRSDESLRWREAAAAPVMRALSTQVAATRVLVAARMLTAFLHGFVSMESAGAFRLGGDPEADFAEALDAVLSALDALS